VICFSEARDDLSQWRGYSSGEGGVAFGFDAASLSSLSKQISFRFAPVLYDLSLQTRIIDRALSWAAMEVSRLFRKEDIGKVNEPAGIWDFNFFLNLKGWHVVEKCCVFN
jgi:hypothetical protein